MCKRKSRIRVTEKFKNEDIDKRKEALEKLLYNIIKTTEQNPSK